MTATEVIFRSGRKRKPTSALLPHGSCATMASPVVQVIFVDESEFENEGNWYFSEHKSVEWEIHSTISQSTSSLVEFSDSEEVEPNTAKLMSPALVSLIVTITMVSTNRM